MRNKVLAIYRNTVPYVKQFRKYVGSIAGCILFQQLDHWFESKPDGFYKFLEKPESDHPQYRDGDSWNEEIGITPDEFRTAFDAIGTRYKSKKEYDLTPDKFQGKFYCSYYDRVARLTWYFRNDDLVDRFLDLIMEGKDATKLLETGIASSGNEGEQSLETGIASSRNGDRPSLETGIASSNLYTNLTTDLTTNKRADEFFAIAPSLQIQENSFHAQTENPRIQETPNPQSPLSPSAPENLGKAIAPTVATSKQAEAYMQFEQRFSQPKPQNRHAPKLLVEAGYAEWHNGKHPNDWRKSLIDVCIQRKKKRGDEATVGAATDFIFNVMKDCIALGFWGKFQELVDQALKLEAAQAIATQVAPPPVETPQQSAPQIDPIAHKRMIEEARRRVAQQAA